MSQETDNKLITRSFIGKQADDLGQLISEQVKPIYQSLGIIVPVKSCSIIHTLYAADQASLAELSRSLRQSHQLVKQKLPRLLKLGLIDVRNDPDDKRKMLYRLTELGNAQAQLLNQNTLTQVYADLSAEINTDLYAVLSAAIKGLKEKNLYARFQAVNNQTE